MLPQEPQATGPEPQTAHHSRHAGHLEILAELDSMGMARAMGQGTCAASEVLRFETLGFLGLYRVGA